MAEQRHDLTGVEIDGGVVHRVDAAEGDGNVLHFHERSALVFHGSYSLLGAGAVDGVEPDGDDENHADDDALERTVDPQEHHARL
ncbi:hypothetical protein D9M70_507660 [compost metagenome]